MEYPDFAFPEEKRSFVSHKDVLEYLRNYAREFGLSQHLRLNSTVSKVKAFPSNEVGNDVKWKISSISSGRHSEDEFDAVVICNGYTC